MTGIKFNDQFDEKIDKAFSGFLDTTQRNNLFREALLLSIEDVYKNLESQKEFDAINSIIRTNQVYNLNNNKLYVMPVPIALIAIGVETFIKTTIPHNLITGDQVLFTEIKGTISVINDIFLIVTVVTSTSFTVTFDSTVLVYTSNTGKISQHRSSASVPKLIPDYIHLLAVKFLYAGNVAAGIRIVDVSNEQPIMVTLNTRNNNIKTGEKIIHSGIIGNTNANGTFFAKKVGALKYQLFYDNEFLKPVSGNGVFSGAALLTKHAYNYAVPLYSYRKISGYSLPTIDKPAFERAENMIKAEPSDKICSEA